MLTDQTISDEWRKASSEDDSWMPQIHERFARAIEAAATAPLLERIAQKQARIDQLVQEVAAGADAEAAQRERIAEQEKEIIELQGAISECNEACGSPPAEGAPLEHAWMSAMGDPLAVALAVIKARERS